MKQLCALLAVSIITATALAQSTTSPTAPHDKVTTEGGADWKNQFKPKLGTTPQPTPAKAKDRVTYTLRRAENPTEEELAAYARITAGMEKAIQFYNKYTAGINKQINVVYSPGTPTADGNINGTIRMGKNAHNERVCMHEICHTVGIGTSPQWGKLVVNGVFTGSEATKLLREITKDKSAVLHADRMHFWPYGLNYDNEVKSDDDLVNHCKMVEAICKDLKAAERS